MVKQVFAAELAHALEECFNQCSVFFTVHLFLRVFWLAGFVHTGLLQRGSC